MPRDLSCPLWYGNQQSYDRMKGEQVDNSNRAFRVYLSESKAKLLADMKVRQHTRPNRIVEPRLRGGRLP